MLKILLIEMCAYYSPPLFYPVPFNPLSLLTQIGWRQHIQSVVTENNLIDWYEKALRGKYAKELGEELILRLCQEIANEFPSVDTVPEVLKNRHYEKISDPYWESR